MPNLTFELPHWLYWSGLVLFPLASMYFVRRAGSGQAAGGLSLPTAYLFWFTAGFVGMHRFYVRSPLGLVYVPLFAFLLWANVEQRDSRLAASSADNNVISAEFFVEQAKSDLKENQAGAAASLDEAERKLETARDLAAGTSSTQERWGMIVGGAAAVIALMLLVDAFLLPRMLRRCAEAERARQESALEHIDVEATMAGIREDPTLKVRTPITDLVDRLSGVTGEFVAYWSIIAVFAYYYEVVARYVFNSPTNWVHEGMFLMFGMQYLISGAFALREDSHVRVDVFYVMLSDRAKAMVDILTSLFFFIFVAALLVTGSIFALDSVNVWEVSFTEWGIQYWPVKASMALGALLLLLQGLAKLLKDVTILVARRA